VGTIEFDVEELPFTASFNRGHSENISTDFSTKMTAWMFTFRVFITRNGTKKPITNQLRFL
jgi:hypothetical protein